MSERLAKSAGLNSLATLSSRLLGLVRDSVLAYLFGTGMAADAFYIASRLPNLVRDLFAEGAMSAAFVPTFTRYLKTDGRAAAWRLGNLVLNGLILATGLIVIVGIIFAEPLLLLMPDDFADADGGAKLELTVQLARLTMPFLTLVAIAVALAGMLNSLRRFFIPALSPALYNVAVIISAVAFVPVAQRLGWHPIFGVAVGSLLGGVLQIATQVPSLYREGFRYQPILSFSDPGMRTILTLMGPATLGVAAGQINVLVNTVLAAGDQGAVSSLQYAFRLMYLPIGLFGVAIATVSLPEVARQATSASFDELRRTVSSSLRMMLMLCVPAAAGLIALAGPIVELIYERGQFDAASTTATATALMFYAPGVIGYSIVKIVAPCFYALQNARTPVIISLTTIAVNIVLNLTLFPIMGFQGLALGTSVASVFNAVALLVFLSRRIDGIDAARIGVALLKIAGAAVVMGAAAWWTEHWLSISVTSNAIVRVFGAITAGVIVLAAGAWVLRLREFLDAVTRVTARFTRRA